MKALPRAGKQYIYHSGHCGNVVATVVSAVYRTVVSITYMEDGKEVTRTVPVAYLREINPNVPLVIHDGKVVSG